MHTIRESLASIPSTVTHYIANATTVAERLTSTSATATPTSTASGTDDGSSSTNSSHQPSSGHGDHKSLPIPASLVKEQWRLIFTSDASIQDLEASIAHCRDLVLLTDECSEERRWLVRHLVDLRYSLQELRDAEANLPEGSDNSSTNSGCSGGGSPATGVAVMPSTKTVVGHHFVLHHRSNRLQAAASRYYCDHCGSIVWSVVQSSYICNDCRFMVHQKCIDNVIRICAHVVASERQYPIAEICPEIGLAAQNYKCAECAVLVNCKSAWVEPRLCDYNGLYYCPSCHWNDHSIIPARVVHNWDFVARKVCRASLQEINLFVDKPLIRLEEANPKLFVFLEKLCSVKKLRQNLVFMRKYLIECRDAMDHKLLDTHIGSRRHLIQSTEFYSINDLEEIESGHLVEFLHRVFTAFDQHIRHCSMCTAKAYICEICSNNEVIFPFDDGCVICDKCNSIFHRVCMTRKNMICPKCVRLQERRNQKLESDGNQEDDDVVDHGDRSAERVDDGVGRVIGYGDNFS